MANGDCNKTRGHRRRLNQAFMGCGKRTINSSREQTAQGKVGYKDILRYILSEGRPLEGYFRRQYGVLSRHRLRQHELPGSGTVSCLKDRLSCEVAASGMNASYGDFRVNA